MRLNTVSISCTTYNHANFIKKCLEGFLMQQTDFEFEILIYDDASTDGTQEIIKTYKKKYPDIIKPIFQTENQYSKGVRGIMARFNFSRAQGKYIALCEGDDYWTDPLKLQKQVDFLEEHEEYIVCFTRFQTRNENTSVFEQDKNGHYFTDENKIINFDFKKFYKGWHIGTQTVVFKNKSSIINNFLKYNQPRDIALYTELLKAGKGACLKEFSAVYRITGQGVYTSVDKKDQIKKGVEVYQDIFTINKNNYYLGLKYRKFLKPYLQLLLNEKKVIKFLNEVFQSYRLTNNISYVREDLGLLLKKIKTKL